MHHSSAGDQATWHHACHDTKQDSQGVPAGDAVLPTLC